MMAQERFQSVRTGQQLVDGTLLYTDDKVTSQNFGDTFTAISDEGYPNHFPTKLHFSR